MVAGETETCRRELVIEVPAEAVRQEVERVTRSLQQKARVPGFRPGKAPTGLVRERFGDDIRQEVLHHLVPEYFERRVKEENLQPVSGPEIGDVHLRLDGAEPLRFKAVFEVVPSFELKDYTGLEVDVEEPSVTEPEVEAELKQLQENEATYLPVESRPLQDGDFASISMKGKAANAADSGAVKLDHVYCEIGGADTLSAFTENLRGVSPGEERIFPVSYPQDYSDRRLAGRTVEYTTRVHEVKQKQVPELNDDFARDLGDYASLEEVRNDIRNKLLEQKRHRAEHEAKDKLLQRLTELHPFQVPESLVEKQVQSRMERTVRQLVGRGVDPRKLDLDWSHVRASQRENALRDLQASLILERIAEAEGIAVTREELEREIEDLARQAARGKESAVLHARLTKPEVADRIKNRLRSDKTLDFVYRKATKITGRSGAGPKP